MRRWLAERLYELAWWLERPRSTRNKSVPISMSDAEPESTPVLVMGGPPEGMTYIGGGWYRRDIPAEQMKGDTVIV